MEVFHMATPEIVEKLRKLTKNEVKVLFFHCRDDSEQKITDKLNGLEGTNIQVETIRTRKTKIYEKLEIPSKDIIRLRKGNYFNLIAVSCMKSHLSTATSRIGR